jgi:hypothetical protein
MASLDFPFARFNTRERVTLGLLAALFLFFAFLALAPAVASP